MNPTYDFTGQVALVTGAAKGMGLATTRMFAKSGASVVLADINGDLAAAAAEQIAQFRARYRGQPAGRLGLHEARASCDA